MKFTLDWKEYADTAREMVAEGCVLLKNDNETLPLKSGMTVSVFGRIQYDYIKSGTGSGGMVNAPYVISIFDALKEEEDIHINEELSGIYEEWLKDHPFDKGAGWAMEPWSQVEMPLTDEIVKNAVDKSDAAIIIIGRSAGEDRDNSQTKGSYYLTDDEEDMLSKVCAVFDKTIVLLNVGNIIDMNFVRKYNPSSVMYVWQGGSEGGHGVVDLLTGRVTPSGKLADTIIYNLEDHPAHEHFGDEKNNDYVEDIYVGYRYFETAAKDKVMYPFGFGLSYTSFSHSSSFSIIDDETVRISTVVENTGDRFGKEVVQIYVKCPQNKLCKPARELVGFSKSGALFPGAKEVLTLDIKLKDLASFDDSGVTGHKDAWVLEAGEYVFYAGSDVRSAEAVGSFSLGNTVVTEQLSEALTPVKEFKRMVITEAGNDAKVCFEEVPLRGYDLKQRVEDNMPKDRECTGNKGIKFSEVVRGDAKVEEFLDQLTDDELISLSRGEGMCSPKVTPGVASCFGGCAESLRTNYGMPIAACSDGPSGIRMDCGAMAFSLPNGAVQACSFNVELIGRLYEYEAKELRYNKIDTLLGPGLNIHRYPLNGRNFEYYSEDPYLTGACAVAELNAMHKYDVTGTVKHFATNNQEWKRHFVNATVSARALREIYLKPFEMAIKQGHAYCVMTTYGPLNGIYTGSNYDLTTTVLRNEWGFTGMVMTDWWAKLSETIEGGAADVKYTSSMIKAQNDTYMVTADAVLNGNDDNSERELEKGIITRGELLRNAFNVCVALKKSAVSKRLIFGDDEIEILNPPKGADKKMNYIPHLTVTETSVRLPLEDLNTVGGTENVYTIHVVNSGIYELAIKVGSDAGELSQTTMAVSVNNIPSGVFTLTDTHGQYVEKLVEIDSCYQQDIYINIYFAQSGLKIDSLTLTLKKNWTMSDKRAEGVLA